MPTGFKVSRLDCQHDTIRSHKLTCLSAKCLHYVIQRSILEYT